jgi:archaetidylinositol phosphate synthase
MLWINRNRFNGFSKNMGGFFSKIPLSPNQWTVLSLLLAFIVFYLLATENFLAAFVLFIFAMSIDMIDGAVARKTKKVTKFGGYLDSVIDRLIEFVIITGLFLVGYPGLLFSSGLWLMLLMLGSFMSTYTRAAAFEKQVHKDLKGGMLEHTDRLVFFAAIILMSHFSLVYASYMITAMAILSNLSALQRFLKVVKR